MCFGSSETSLVRKTDAVCTYITVTRPNVNARTDCFITFHVIIFNQMFTINQNQKWITSTSPKRASKCDAIHYQSQWLSRSIAVSLSHSLCGDRFCSWFISLLAQTSVMWFEFESNWTITTFRSVLSLATPSHDWCRTVFRANSEINNLIKVESCRVERQRENEF